VQDLQTTERVVWFRFVDENGEPYKRSRFGRLKTSSDQKIIEFRDKVHAEYSGFLEGIHKIQLTVREEGATNVLDEETDTVGNRGESKAKALLVVVPASSSLAAANIHTEAAPIGPELDLRSCDHLLAFLEGDMTNKEASILSGHELRT
jgi:hypothetical protein